MPCDSAFRRIEIVSRDEFEQEPLRAGAFLALDPAHLRMKEILDADRESGLLKATRRNAISLASKGWTKSARWTALAMPPISGLSAV